MNNIEGRLKTQRTNLRNKFGRGFLFQIRGRSMGKNSLVDQIIQRLTKHPIGAGVRFALHFAEQLD